MKYDLTLAKIKNTDFASLYDRFIIGEKLSQKQYEILLAIAICFTNAENTNVQQFGYRIMVEYCNQTNDYVPLYEIAVNKGLYPVSKFIEQNHIDDSKKNFFTEWNDAFMEQYVSGEVCRSEQQNSLIRFFDSKKDDTVSVIAPTSYGKSELILSAVKEYAGRKICVLTSTKALLIQTKKRVQQISKDIFPKIVVHPEMYNPNDSSCLAVLTQERLLRIFKKDSKLDQNTVNRIYSDNREDIIRELECEPLRFCTVDSLFAAYVHCGDFNKFAKLIKSGYMNESLDLFAAAYKNSSEWTDLWIQYGFDVNLNSSRLLHRACEKLEVDWAIYLLENGANPYLKEQYSQTVFEKAGGFHGYLDDDQQRDKNRLCKYLLDIGLDPIQESRRSPSILTYMFGKTVSFDFVLIDWLATHGRINLPDLPDECEDTKHLPITNALNAFSSKYNPDVLRYFLQKGAITNAAGITDDKLFISACELCDLDELKLVVDAGADIEETDRYYGTNGLYAAVRKRRPIEIIQYLIELGVSVNSVRNAFRNTHGSSNQYPPTSVLDIAEQNEDVEIVELLKKQGALNAKDIK